MSGEEDVIQQIREAVSQSAPGATLILYGSRARGDHRRESDYDLLVLVEQKKVTRADQKRIKYPLYDVEFVVGKVISPIIFSKEEWQNRYKNTPFYESIRREGKIL